MPDKYKLVGPVYDKLSALYSGDAIHDCKLSMLRPDTIGQDSKVLFAGAGQGLDVLRAAELGAQVTMVDISPTMHKAFDKKRLSRPDTQALEIETILGDILKHEHFGKYDTVVANFFLNVFDRRKMTLLLNHLARLCAPGGQIIIGDFKPVAGGVVNRSIQNVYWYAAATAFCFAAGNAIHRIYDYAPMLEELNFTPVEEQAFQSMGRELYYSLRAQKHNF